jgi:KDO2-lipid IV(A) lauroyltransferase
VQKLLENSAYLGVFFVLQAGGALLRVLPQRFSLFVAQRMADLSFVLIYRFRQRSVSNLRLAFGERIDSKKAVETARNSLRNFFRAFAEIGFALCRPLDAVREEIPMEGKEHLEKALDKGKGVIVLSAHIGNFFLLGSRLGAEGYATRVLVKPTYRDNARFAALMDGYRARLGQKTIRARPRRRAARELIQALRRNELAVLIADEFRSNGIEVPFFGKRVLARRGAVTLAMRTGAAVVPMSLLRETSGNLRLIVEPEIELVHTGNLSQDVVTNTLRLNAWLEKLIRAYPDQWNWMTIRWQETEPDVSCADERRTKRLA